MDVDIDEVAVMNEADESAVSCLRRDVANRNTRRPTRESTVGDQCALCAQASTFQERGGMQHLLHPGPPGWAFIADDDDVARCHLLIEDSVDGILLRFEDACGAREMPEGFIDASSFDDGAIVS